jgi:MFS family permease
LVIFLTVFIDLLGFGMVMPLLPNYAEAFTVDKSGVVIGLLMASFSAMQFLVAPMWGRLSDQIGRRPVLMVGLAGSVVFYTLFGIATVMKSLTWLFIARIGAGIAGATISTAQAYIADTTTLENRTKGMALIGAAFGLGFTFGPLLAFLALPSGTGDPGPGPGYAAAAISAVALLLAYFKLPESRRPDSTSAARRLLDLGALRTALATPSIGPILIAIFVCVVAFGMFETTVSLLVMGNAAGSKYALSFRETCLVFAYIGLTLALAQGFLVRRLSGRLHEGAMAATGAVTEVAGFVLFVRAANGQDVRLLLVALSVVVIGFALLMPSLNALLSRRSDPARQGGILGVGQSLSALARIVGPMIGVPLLERAVSLPYQAAAGMMLVGLVLIVVASKSGRDFVPDSFTGR